jgi:RNA polymerase sigma factor (TIGR02999 family)
MSTGHAQLTKLLADVNAGQPSALEDLMHMVYAQLRQLAERFLRGERDDHTLQPTALVHEAFLKLTGHTNLDWKDRQHFFRTAAQAMRRILVDYARSHKAQKRGGDRQKLTLEDVGTASTDDHAQIVAVDAALQRLQSLDPRQSQIVELRFFGGLTISEAAEVMNLSPATIKREWTLARAWLHREVTEA